MAPKKTEAVRSALRGKGRPKARNPRNHILNIRLTADEDQLLEAMCDNFGKERAVLARDILLEGLINLKAEESKADRSS